MVEFKIRAFDIEYNKMVYPEFSFGFGGLTKGEIIDRYENVIFSTGIRDCSGTEIWEGDILFNETKNHYFKVFRVQGGFAVNTHPDDFKKKHILFYEGLSDMQDCSWVKHLKIVGNIYQNTELL